MKNYQKILSVMLALILAFGALTAIPAAASDEVDALPGDYPASPDATWDSATPDSTWDEWNPSSWDEWDPSSWDEWDPSTWDEDTPHESTVDEQFPDFVFTVRDVAPDITGYDGSDQEAIVGVCLDQYTGCDEYVVVPDELGGYPVYVIGSYAFRENGAIRGVELPDTAIIGWAAFSGCTSLETITLPAAQRSIDDQMFYGCTSLREVNIPASVNEIRRQEAANMPHRDPFAFCGAIESFNVDGDNPNYTSVDGAIYTKDMSTLVAYPTAAGWVDIPDSVTTIGDRALAYNPNLSTVIVPDSVTSIGNAAFADCPELCEIDLPNSSVQLGFGLVGGTEVNHDVDGVVCVDKIVYSYNNNLPEDVVLPENATRICKAAFNEKAEWVPVTLDGEQYFDIKFYSADFKTITIPASVVSIGDFAFVMSSPAEGRSIRGYRGSAAEEAAETYGYNFIPIGKIATDEATGISVGLPEDLDLAVTQLPAEEGALAVYDISVTKDGQTVQPDGRVAVRIPCTEKNVKVYRIEADGSRTDMDADYVDGYQVFLTDHFSKYIVAEAPRVFTVKGKISGYIEDGKSVCAELIAETYSEAIADGSLTKFSFNISEKGEYIIRISKENHVTREYQLTVESDVTLDVKLHPLGDINGDGKVTTVDFGRANSHARGKSTLSGYEFDCADVNHDGSVSTVDAGRINSHARGKSKLW